jgi:putative membrane-bound dehydrogenase-like protein
MRKYLFVCLCTLVACQNPPVGQPPKPSPLLQKALDDFDLAEGFSIELVAAEPLVADPVAMEIDENGQMYVVEMHGYPLDLAGSGKIKLLRDTNGDGYPDQATVFAEGLVLPTGLLRWRKGLLVTDAPHVWYLEDTNNDGRADIKRAMLSGFALSNPQHNLNTPVWGLDNWIYLAHQWAVTPIVCQKEFFDQGTEVHFPARPSGPRLGKNADDRNVRFKPDSFELEALSGETQFGQTFDNFGHHFLNENAHHAYQEVLAARYLRRNPNLLVPDAIQNMPDHGDACEVFPTTEKPDHQLLTDVGVMTSACGITFYNGGKFSPKWNDNSLFVAEPVHNLVHADELQDDGVVFKTHRKLEKKEFLSSRDGWFRPVNFYVGPEGALYVVDYHRRIIEHPEWMSDEVNKSGALYQGTDQGRIYRIVPRGGLPMNWLGRLDLSKKSDKDLIALLNEPNGWYRRTAQRLLFERKTKEIDALRAVALEAPLPEARVHALWLLEGLEATDSATLLENMAHSSPGVRENVLKIAENHWEQLPALASALLKMPQDPSARVRFQALCSIGGLTDSVANGVKMKLLAQQIQDPWMQLAGISAFAQQEHLLLDWAVKNLAQQPSESHGRFFMMLAATIAHSGSELKVRELFRKIEGLSPAPAAYWKAAVLEGLAKLWENTGVSVPISEAQRVQVLAQFQEKTPAVLRRAALHWLEVVGLPKQQTALQNALALAQNTQVDTEFRADAITLLGLKNPASYQTQLEGWLQNHGPLTVQQAALHTLSACENDQMLQFLIKNFPQFRPELQDQTIELLLESPRRATALLAAVAQKKISAEKIGWRRMVRLMNNDDVAVRKYARRVLATQGLTRESVLTTYQPALHQKGDYQRGQQIFARVCQTCHQLNGEGIAFGPELSSLRNRPAEHILKEIIIPNNSIADKFEYWTATLKNGRQLEGIISVKTSTTLTFRQLGGAEQVLARDQIRQLKASDTSAMPNGLEGAITVPEMADLLAYIKNIR